ncbi:MAG: DUF4239 domain-containing protein [Gemmatales bacterium]
MSSFTIAGIAFACVFGGALVGMYLRTLLREHHLSSETKDVVKVGIGLIATMSALVLGLLVASAKSSFDTKKNEIGQISANIVLLDRALAHFGPETKETRELLRTSVERLIGLLWPTAGATSQVQPTAASEVLFDRIESLTPKTDAQRALQAQSVKTVIDIGQTRWLLYAQSTSAVSPPFLFVVLFWLTITFLSFGLYAPRNSVVFATLFLCALSVAGALFLVLELDRPFTGYLQISSEPMRNALEQLGR